MSYFPSTTYTLAYDTRTFKYLEPVLLNDKYYSEGVYIQSVPQPGTNKIYTHIIRSDKYDRWVKWEDVGKRIWPVSKTGLLTVMKEKTGKDIPQILAGY